MKTTKTTLPKKPITKRDKYFYEMGAEQQADVFDELYDDKWRQWSRKSLGDYQEPITNEKDYTVVIFMAVIVALCILIAHPYILAWINNQ